MLFYRPMERPRPRFLPCALVSILAAAVYARTLGFGFVFDDLHLIVGNAFLRESYSPLRAFAHHFWYGTRSGTGYYRPLVVASLALNGRIPGWGPIGFHLVNVLLHAGNAALVFVLGRRLGLGERPASLAGALFAVHPAASWAVASIVARVDLLAAFFVLLAWISSTLATWPRWRRAALTGLFFLCALLCKESAAAFLVVPLIGLLSEKEKKTGPAVATITALGAYVGMRLLAGAGLLLGLERIDPSINPLAYLPLPRRILAALALTGRYLLYLLAPVVRFRDHAGYAPSAAPRPFAYAWALASLLLLLAWAGAAALLTGRRDRTAAPLAFSLASFLPASNLIVPIASLYALNFLYLPLVGLTLAVGEAFERRERAAETAPGEADSRRSPGTWFVPALVMLLAVLSVREAGIWRDDVSLFTSWTRRFRHYGTAYSHLGAALLAQGDPSDAIPPLRKGLAMGDSSADAHYDLGAALARAAMPSEDTPGTDPEVRRYLEEALTETRAALRLSPELVPALVNESKILLMLGRPAESEKAARAALGIAPAYPPALQNLGAALFRQSRYAEAAAEFNEMVRLDPTDRSARSHHVVSLIEAGDLESARKAALAARAAFPDDAWFDFCLARVEARAGREEESLALLKSALAKNPSARAWFAQTSDFEAYRNHQGFKRLVEP